MRPSPSQGNTPETPENPLLPGFSSLEFARSSPRRTLLPRPVDARSAGVATPPKNGALEPCAGGLGKDDTAPSPHTVAAVESLLGLLGVLLVGLATAAFSPL